MIDETTIDQEIKEALAEKQDNPNTSTGSPDTTIIANNSDDELESAFEQFASSKSTHEHEVPEKTQANTELFPAADNLSAVDDFKLQIFLGFFFSLIDGLHVFIYRFVAKVQFDKELLTLGDDDKEALQVYFKTNRILKLINKLPSEIIGIVHMEYLYFQKFQEIKKAQEKPKDRVLLHTPTGKKAAAKKSGKKKATRKKAAKKAAPKKQSGE